LVRQPDQEPATGWTIVARTDALIVVGIILMGVVLPLVLSNIAGSLGIARNDDWAYRRDVVGLSRTGRLVLTGWESMTLVGQLLWGGLFARLLGNPAWGPDVSTAVLASAGLLSAYVLARRVLDRFAASIATLSLVVAPGFALS